MYKILTKYTSTAFNKTFWKSHMSDEVEFQTESKEELEREILKLDKEIGFSNIRIINDISFDVLAELGETIDLDNAEVASLADIDRIYNEAHNDVFTD